MKIDMSVAKENACQCVLTNLENFDICICTM